MLCDQRTSEDGGDDSGQQTASVDGQVEDGEESAPLLLLLDTSTLNKLWTKKHFLQEYIGCILYNMPSDIMG